MTDIKHPFKLKIGQDTFNYKYRHEGAETWSELADSLVRNVCHMLPVTYREGIAQLIKEMKFIPGGRYLYYANRKRRYYNNCLSRGTKFYTSSGLLSFEDFEDGDTVYVINPITGLFTRAEVCYHGKQRVFDVVMQNVRGRSDKTWTVRATRDHRWILKDGTETTNIDVGDIVAPSGYNFEEDLVGWIHGAVFADGNLHTKVSGFGHQLRLCGKKSSHLDKFLSLNVADSGVVDKITHSHPEFASGDPCLYISSSVNFKDLPTDKSPNYVASFIKGWLDFDGHDGEVKSIHTIDRKALEFFVENCVYAGLVVSGKVKVAEEDSNFGARKPLYYVRYRHHSNFSGFKVVAIEDVGDYEEDVWCLSVPECGSFVLENGIVTGNCYVMLTEEDTRQDWARISWQVENCLMTGGGVGVDYSMYRPAGSLIRSTGGTASGPVPKMKMTNEIGRHVMQGGSRRSALYASLDHDHEDIHEFLKCKDWHHMKVPGTAGLTIADLKAADFNYNAPLDMTNISVNYNTEWLENFKRTGDPGAVFMTNVAQALQTAEPGFSFNFYDKEEETGRNACTEFTSSDDSDVCNLGSLNLARIETYEEFCDAVELATAFLFAGTLTAELPYKKVEYVRERNRRLGLGLMGVHEWLLKAGYKYEMTAELRKWLAAYKDLSTKTAKDLAQSLSCSTPKATRAIAPTGTIGMLASTTTGIEPIYAVAYKRRYLRGGSEWHYQYVLDESANRMVRDYGLDPEEVETAVDLASDYERRISFQADVQDYVDMAISSTINLPAWDTELNNEGIVSEFGLTLAKYAERLRGFTCYPDGARGGQPLTAVKYEEAAGRVGEEFVETPDICEITGKGGVCGV